MRKLILSLIAALGLAASLAGCAAPKPPSHDDAMQKLTGGYAMIYGGSYEAATSLIGSARVLMPGKITLGNESGTASFGERTRFIDSSIQSGFWGSALVAAGTWRVYRIEYQNMLGGNLGTDTFGFPADTTITVAPGEVVYIGQFEVPAPSLTGMFADRRAIRRDDFARFRDALRAVEPDLAARVVYRPLQSSVIVDAP